MRISKMWNELSMKEKADIIKVGVKHGITNLADIRAKYDEFALGGNLYDDGGPKTRYTADGRTLTYSTVPASGEVRWIDFSDSKDFDGVTGNRFYDNAGNKMHYTRWQETAPEATVQPAPTKSEADNLVRARGYNPDITRPMLAWLRKPHEQGLQGVYPEFALLTGGRSLVNGALGYVYDAAKPYAAQAWQAMKPGGSFWTTYQKPITQFAESMLLGESANEAARISGYNGWGDFAATTVEKATGPMRC